MAANNQISEITSTGPQFQAFYVIPMPYLDILDSPFFEEANISEFLKRFENMYDTYQRTTSEKICHLP